MKKIIFLLIVLMIFILPGCGASITDAAGSEESTFPISEAPESAAVDTEATLESSVPAEVAISDMAGRSVVVSSDIQTVCATGQPGAVLLYTLCPEKLIAWNSEIAENSLCYIADECADLPVIGSMQGGSPEANEEEVVALAPDIIIYMTTITSKTASVADTIEAAMGIPVITVCFDLESIGESYTFLGQLLGCPERAAELGIYCDNLIAEVTTIAASIPEEQKISFYYTTGGKGLQTSPTGSSHTELIELVGGINVVDLEAESNGRLEVNMEQVLAWNPDVIITSPTTSGDDSLYQTISNADGNWGPLGAVLSDSVYCAPVVPFSWLDAPVSANRMIGICWAAQTLYPDVYDYDLNACIKEFYGLFYGINLTDEQIGSLLS